MFFLGHGYHGFWPKALVQMKLAGGNAAKEGDPLPASLHKMLSCAPDFVFLGKKMPESKMLMYSRTLYSHAPVVAWQPGWEPTGKVWSLHNHVTGLSPPVSKDVS